MDTVSPHTVSTAGFGASVDGVLVPRWARRDKVKFAANAGWGIGRYIKDLDEAGGQDAVYDSNQDTLRALAVASGYIGYERHWRPTLLSAFTYGLVSVNNLDAQTADSLHRTYRSSLNLTWMPAQNTDLVVEFLAGRRRNKDGAEGTSGQVQAGWTVRF